MRYADFNQLVVYRIVGGVGIGVVSIVSPLYIRGVGSSVSWTLGITLSISGYHWLFRSLSNELSVAWCMLETHAGAADIGLTGFL